MTLPLFFMVLLTLILTMDAVKLQSAQNLELSNQARKLSMAAAAAGTWLDDGKTTQNTAGNDGETKDGTWIDLAKTAEYPWPFSLPGLPKLKLAVRARVYPWSGTKNGVGAETSDGSGTENETVLVTEYASVWHSHEDCSHLDLSVFESTTEHVGELRNIYGKRYRRCAGFPKDYSGPVYLTEKGDYYYPNKEYAGLTRTVRIVTKKEIGDRKQCERCAARDKKEAAGGRTEEHA
ncbi:MAG: hypothetical protein Q4B09_09430 [Lachnospiraceae bacterium]|nr:hypothetical protein [Lachnospiraceae bacterium]